MNEFLRRSALVALTIIYCTHSIQACSPVTIENDEDLTTTPAPTGPPDPTPTPAATPPPARKGQSALQNWLGSDIETEKWNVERYVAEGGGPVIEGGELLDCDFESECCYRNALPPEDQLEWVLVDTTAANPQSTLRSFGTDIPPSGKFLVAASPGPEDPFAEARFFSCAIGCTNQPVVVTLRYWITTEVLMLVCTRDSFHPGPDPAELLNCQLLPEEAVPGPYSVVMPPGDNFEIVIVATNFLREDGGMAVMDDIIIDYVTCQDEITTTTPTTTTEATTEAPVTTPTTTPSTTTTRSPNDLDGTLQECFLECDFEEDNMCGYQVDGLISPNFLQREAQKLEGVDRSFETRSGRFGNPVTGVRKAARGDFYTASYLYAGNEHTIDTETDLAVDRMIVFFYMLPTFNTTIQACCDNICFDVDSHTPGKDKAEYADYLEWLVAAQYCPQGTKNFAIKCFSIDAAAAGTKTQGACAIDEISLWKTNENFNVVAPAC